MHCSCVLCVLSWQTADGICSAVKLCSSVGVVTPPTAILVSTPQTPVTCQICDFVAKLLVITTQSDSSKVRVHNYTPVRCQWIWYTVCIYWVVVNFYFLVMSQTHGEHVQITVIADVCDLSSLGLSYHPCGFFDVWSALVCTCWSLYTCTCIYYNAISVLTLFVCNSRQTSRLTLRKLARFLSLLKQR